MSKLAQALIEKEKEEKTGYLDLGRCGLTELPDLSGMDWLETLVLSDRWWDWERKEWIDSQSKSKPNVFNAIYAKFLPNSLTKIVLSFNRLSDWRFLENLSQLHTLYLSDIGLRDGRFLEKLSHLQTLDLSNNRLSDWRFLEKLSQLHTLDLGSTNFIDVEFLEKLPQLHTLDLKNNGLRGGRFLEKLPQLYLLNLSYNNIRDGQFLEKLPKLNVLNLSYNDLSGGHFLEKLPQLHTLHLRYNSLSDWRFLEKLPLLRTLDLSGNRLSDWRVVEELPQLQSLYLSGNSISDGHFLENLPELKTLDLSDNKISDWRFLEKLPQLQTLHLRGNSISDGHFLGKLPNLTQIDLSKNHIKDLKFLESFLREKKMEIVWNDYSYEVDNWQINVKDNPLENPPLEIIKQGNTAILEYFRQKEKSGTSLLNEAKLILLGDGRAGKTSLANRMLGKELPKEADRTQGVDIIIGEHTFPLPEDKTFKLHIWDFAGQDKYKPLHQFFYTEGAVYVLVADSGNAGTDYDDWFQTAQLFGTGSPVLVALNEFRDGVGFGTYDPEHWQKRFPGLLKEHFLVNLKTQKNFEPLKKAIHFQAQNLPHTQVEYPKNWAAVRQELERRRDENFISLGEYLNICKANDLPEKESALVLSGVLHRIGVCLHYQQSPLLRQHVMLKNEWATEAVYRILEDQVVAEDKKGFFNWEDLKRIWSDEAYCDMQPQLLELMQQFKMAYPLPNSQEYVAPPLLPPAPPQGWEFPAGQALELFVEYEFLPKALLTQFIVSRHTDIDEGRTLVWRNGVVLRWPDALAQVEKTKSQGRDAFSIRCQGNNRKGLLTAILKTFRDLHSEYKGIKFAEIVPCPCSACLSGLNKQYYFKFEHLKNRLEKGRRIVECEESLEEVELVRLLGDLLLFEHLAPGQPVVMSQNVGEQAPWKEQIAAPLAYFAYAPEDSTFLTAFQKQLHPLVRSGKIRLWDNNKIKAGDEKDATTQKSLQQAEIIFLLLSPDFLSVEAIWELEVKAAIARHEVGKARVIPIKVRPCHWEDSPFGALQSLPREENFISNSADQDGAWVEVVKEIKSIIEEWNKNKKLP